MDKLIPYAALVSLRIWALFKQAGLGCFRMDKLIPLLRCTFHPAKPINIVNLRLPRPLSA